MKKKSRPGNSMKVNAYAANAAIRIGMIVAGMVITKLLTNAFPMPWLSTSWYPSRVH